MPDDLVFVLSDISLHMLITYNWFLVLDTWDAHIRLRLSVSMAEAVRLDTTSARPNTGVLNDSTIRRPRSLIDL